MTARLPVRLAATDLRRSPQSDRTVALRRVLSVSPSALTMSDSTPPQNGTHPPNGRANGVRSTAPDPMLTPRVIDQRVVRELTDSLRAVLDDAQNASEQLRQGIDNAGVQKTQLTQATTQLQDRIRLGARMIKAFQSQIVRIESAIEDFVKTENNVDSIQREIDSRLNVFQTRLDEMVDRAINRVDEAADERERSLKDLEARLNTVLERTERMTEAADTAEQNVFRLAFRQGKGLLGIDERIARMESMLQRADAMASDLTRTTTRAETQCREATGRVDEGAEAYRRAREQFEELRQEIRGDLAYLDERRAESELDIQTCEALEQMVERLEPWRTLIEAHDDATSDPSRPQELPAPVRRMVEAARGEFSRELGRLAEGLRQLAGPAGEASGATTTEVAAGPGSEAPAMKVTVGEELPPVETVRRDPDARASGDPDPAADPADSSAVQEDQSSAVQTVREVLTVQPEFGLPRIRVSR